MLKRKQNKLFLLIISTCFYFVSGQQNTTISSIDVRLKSISKTTYSNQNNFKKAIAFYLNKNYDSTLVYCQRQLISNNKIEEINDYCHLFRAVSFQSKKLFKEALNEVHLVSKKFQFYYYNRFTEGQLYIELYQFEQALTCMLDVEKNIFKSNVSVSLVYQDIGHCYLFLKNFKESETYFLKAASLYKKEKNKDEELITIYQNLANLYYEQYKDNLAIPYFEKAYVLSKNSKSYNAKKQCAQNMAVVEENRKNFEKAIGYRKEAEVWNDSLTDQNKIWAVAEVEKKFAVNQKEKEIRVLEVENEIKKTQRNGLFIIAILLLGMFGVGYYFYRQKIIANKIIMAQKENLDELNATKDKLFSIVSHDLRSSVNALKTSNTKLLKHLETKNYNELDVLLHKNSAIANSSYNLLDNLLNWAQQQTNQLFFQQESLHLFSIVEQIEYNYKPLAFDKNIELKCNIDKNIFVFMDLDSLKIILRNLLDNALKFSHENGIISIYVQNTNANFVELVIEDTGLGMSEKVIHELLQDTMQLSKKENKEIIGTGLGMQLCKSMLAKNGGKLAIESKEGSGTKIILFLPKDFNNG